MGPLNPQFFFHAQGILKPFPLALEDGTRLYNMTLHSSPSVRFFPLLGTAGTHWFLCAPFLKPGLSCESTSGQFEPSFVSPIGPVFGRWSNGRTPPCPPESLTVIFFSFSLCDQSRRGPPKFVRVLAGDRHEVPLLLTFLLLAVRQRRKCLVFFSNRDVFKYVINFLCGTRPGVIGIALYFPSCYVVFPPPITI